MNNENFNIGEELRDYFSKYAVDKTLVILEQSVYHIRDFLKEHSQYGEFTLLEFDDVMAITDWEVENERDVHYIYSALNEGRLYVIHEEATPFF